MLMQSYNCLLMSLKEYQLSDCGLWELQFMGSFYFILQQSRSYYLKVRSENLNFLLILSFSRYQIEKCDTLPPTQDLLYLTNLDNKFYCLYYLNFPDKIKCFG